MSYLQKLLHDLGAMKPDSTEAELRRELTEHMAALGAVSLDGTVTRIEPSPEPGWEFAVVTFHGQEVARFRQYSGHTTEGDEVSFTVTLS